MISIENIIDEEFEGADIDEIIAVLSNNKLYSFLNKSIGLINKHLNNDITKSGILDIEHVLSGSLIRINEHLRDLTAKNLQADKERLEYILANISKNIILRIIRAVPEKTRAVQINRIKAALEETCVLYAYNFDLLTEFIQVNTIALEIYSENSKFWFENSKVVNPPNEQVPSLICIGEIDQANMVNIFVDLEICDDRENLNKLFESPTANIAIRFNQSKIDYVLQFITYLYGSKCVKSNISNGFLKYSACM